MNVSMNLTFVIYPLRVVFVYLGIVVNCEPWSILCEAHTLRIYMRSMEYISAFQPRTGDYVLPHKLGIGRVDLLNSLGFNIYENGELEKSTQVWIAA